jgi:hypothetical protein
MFFFEARKLRAYLSRLVEPVIRSVATDINYDTVPLEM